MPCLEELRVCSAVDETSDFSVLAQRYEVEPDVVADCAAALLALEEALGEDLALDQDLPQEPPPPQLPDYELTGELRLAS